VFQKLIYILKLNWGLLFSERLVLCPLYSLDLHRKEKCSKSILQSLFTRK